MNAARTQAPFKRRIFELALLFIVCLLIFSNTLKNDFIWDDVHLISKNPYLSDFKNIPLFFYPDYWKNLHPIKSRGEFRPVRTVSFTLDYYLWGLNPAGYHLTNLLLHIINVMLVYFFIEQLICVARHKDRSGESRIQRFGIPFLAALFFAAHPVHTESVTYIKNRSELLAFLFLLVSLILFIQSEIQSRRRFERMFYPGALITFILALLSKETPLVFPFVIVLFALCFLPRDRLKTIIIKTVPFVVILLCYFGIKACFLNAPADIAPGLEINSWQKTLAVVKTLAWYLKLLIFPLHLNAEHCFKVPQSVFDPIVLISLGVLLISAGITAGAVVKKSSLIVFATTWLFVALLPVSNIIFLHSRPLAEQRLYLPSFGFCLLLAVIVNRPRSSEPKGINRKALSVATMVLTVIITILFSIITIKRNMVWRNELGFYTSTVRHSPESPRMRLNLGAALAENGRLNEAIQQILMAIRLQPDMAEAYYNLGSVLEKLGNLDDASKQYQTALDLNPDYAKAWNNLGVATAKQGRLEEAITYFSDAVQIKPDFADAYYNIGFALNRLGRLDDAVKNYADALRLEPKHIEALCGKGEVLMRKKQYRKALQDFYRVQQINPNHVVAARRISECLKLIQRSNIKR